MIKEVRKQAGMTMKQVSELTGVPLRSIQNWEGGVRQCPPYIETMVVEKIVAATKKAVVITTPDGAIAIAIVSPDGSFYHDMKMWVTEGKIPKDILDRLNELQKNGYSIHFNL